MLGCARFPEIFHYFAERQTIWSLCSVFVLTFTLQLPIQTQNSVAPELQVFARSCEKSETKFKKTSISLLDFTIHTTPRLGMGLGT